MKYIRIGRPEAGSERPWPGLSRRTRETRPSSGLRRSRRSRVPERRRDMMAWAVRRLWLAGRTVIRAVTMAHHEQVRMWECVLLDQRGVAAHRSRSAALGSVARRFPARRAADLPGPGPERNGAIARAGGRGPRSRPRHRQRIRQDHPEPTDREQLQHEPGVLCPPRRRSTSVRSCHRGKNTRAHHRQPTHRQAARQHPAERPGQSAA